MRPADRLARTVTQATRQRDRWRESVSEPRSRYESNTLFARASHPESNMDSGDRLRGPSYLEGPCCSTLCLPSIFLCLVASYQLSYQGMPVTGKVVLVTGASGVVGGAIARRLLEEGAFVIAPVRSDASRPKLLSRLGGAATQHAAALAVPTVDYGTQAGAAALAAAVSALAAPRGGLFHSFAISGGAAPSGALSAVTPVTLAQAMEKVSFPIWLAQALLPLYHPGPSQPGADAKTFTVVTGALGEHAMYPDQALTSISYAALYGVVLALRAELEALPGGSIVDVRELRIGAPVGDSPEALASCAFAAMRLPRDADTWLVRVGREQLEEAAAAAAAA